jgi:tetratricopeptide (TPR) repeat protein
MTSNDHDNARAESRWHRVEEIFHQVQGAPPSERPVLLTNRCDGDSELESEVQSLLDASEAEGLLSVQKSAEARQADSANRGKLIGPYQLDEILGRGGMGAVYLAHRADGEFNQRVAIKLIDLPLATELFRERFRLERQIQAGLVHPYIARLMDGGVSESGDLYLVMEYVEGVSITRYAQDHELSLRDRLNLFYRVCEAVQFAHQNLVVHRDIKPDNILVVADGTPRLLDFGTAKLLGPVAAESSAGFTQHGLRSFTPQYASPEQVLGEPITTASDTYSLGVLLFVLLTGVPPYAMQDFTTAEMLRVICTEPPPRPSAAPMGPGRVQLRVDADLDAIVLKALRKEPQLRYVSVEQFGADILAWLAGQPVKARRGTRRYRTGKFIRRNALVLLATALLAGSILAGMLGVLWQARVATAQRQRAEARSEDLRELSNSLLSEIDEAIKELPGSTRVQRLLVERVLDHLDRMSTDAAGDPRTQFDLISAYTRLGNLQGNPYDQNIGDSVGALTSLDKALEIAKSLVAVKPGDADVIGAMAQAEQSRAEILFGIGRTSEALDSMRAAAVAFNARAKRANAVANDFADAASAAGGLGDELGQMGAASLGDPEGALAAYRKSLELSHQALSIDPHLVRSLRSVANTRLKIGNMMLSTDPASAINEFRDSILAWQSLPAAERESASARRGVSAAHMKVAMALAEARDYVPSLAEFEATRHDYEFFAAADTTDTRAQYDLALFLSGEALTDVDMLNPVLNPDIEPSSKAYGETLTRALELLRRSVAIREKLVKVDPSNRGWQANLAFEKAVLGGLMQSATSGKEGVLYSSAAVTSLMSIGSAQDASTDVLDFATTAMLVVVPVRLRNPAWTVAQAERLVTLTHGRKPTFLLTLAEAYKQNGQQENAVMTANQGLALLPALGGGAKAPRLWTLLSHVAEPR